MREREKRESEEEIERALKRERETRESLEER